MSELPTPRGFVVTLTHPDGRQMRNCRFSTDASMRQAVGLFERQGWVAGPVVTLERHELATAVEVLRPKAGDVVLLRERADLSTDQYMAYRQACKAIQHDLPGVLVILAGDLGPLERLDEDAMRRAGWVRAEEAHPLHEVNWAHGADPSADVKAACAAELHADDVDRAAERLAEPLPDRRPALVKVAPGVYRRDLSAEETAGETAGVRTIPWDSPAAPAECTCPTAALMTAGCRCGAMKGGGG